MQIQEVAISNNQKKKLLKRVHDDAVLFQDDNGDLVVNVAAYVEFKKAIKKDKKPAPIEAVVGDDILDYEAEYFVFS